MPVQLMLADLDSRARAIFREVVETYLETGEPVGSRTISRRGIGLSPASIRSVMADLADLGLLDAPHASAGRNPTHIGLRIFVDGLLQAEDLSDGDRKNIEERLDPSHTNADGLLARTCELLSGLSGGAGLVSSPRIEEAPITHVEFVSISNTQALAIIVTSDGNVENRVLNLPAGLPVSTLGEAGNYLSWRMKGHTLGEAIALVRDEIGKKKAALDDAATHLVESGVASWSGEEPGRGRSLIVRGRANLLKDGAVKDLQNVRDLFDELERKQTLISILDRARNAGGVRLFIGAENPLFSLSGSSLVVAPYESKEHKIVGALAVIGPTRINYARIIPMVRYTARSLGRLIDKVGAGRP